jgi:NtrC-family two-component system sensor histidine kinase KinB
MDAVRSEAETKGVSLSADCAESLPPVRADMAQITRVLINLITNAVRYTPAGGMVSVSAKVDENDKSIEFSVRDNGTGIPPDYISRIFERFVQVPGAARGGAGLGLSIARTIVRAHDGDIRVESEQGKGSQFLFTLPLAMGNEGRERDHLRDRNGGLDG